MPLIGVSRPKVAKYTNNNGVVGYSDGCLMGKAVEMQTQIQFADNNDFYADNGMDAVDREFQSGSITAKTNNLSQEVTKMLTGAQSLALTGSDAIEGVTDTDIQENIYNNKKQIIYTGVGWIEKWRLGNETFYKAIIYAKVAWNVPANAATTQGASIDWQVPEISGAILRDDTADQNWKRDAGMFTTEAQADAYVNARLNIQASVVTPTPVTEPAEEEPGEGGDG